MPTPTGRAHLVDRPTSGSTEGLQRPRHHPRSGLGRARFRAPGFEDKVFYVWFDAPIEYIAATAEWAAAAPTTATGGAGGTDADDVRYTQFMAKDNVPFHTVTFPATLIGSREPWKRADVIKGFNWLTYYGGKFSTSRNRGIFMDQALENCPPTLALVPDRQRARERRHRFHVARFVADVNKDLADIFGNLVNRIVSFAHRAFDGRIPEGGAPDEAEHLLARELEQRIATLRRHHEALSFVQRLPQTRAIWVVANAYLQHAAPWTAIKSDRLRAAIVTRTGLNLVRTCAVLAWSIVPSLSENVLHAFGGEDAAPRWPRGPIADLLDGGAGTAIAPIGPLVEKISPERASHLAARFGP